MTIDPDTLRAVAALTEVLRSPKQMLATFGTTVIRYYLLTEPSYSGLLEGAGMKSGPSETVVRSGKVTSERPQIVTPHYLLNLFRGFEHGSDYARHLHEAYGAHSPGLMYSYRNDLEETSIVSDPLATVAGRLTEQIEGEGNALAAVVRGVDALWDVSLMKFIFELTMRSLGQNVADLGDRGLLGQERGMPRAVRSRLEEMFAAVALKEMDPVELKAELDRWGVFAEYEDRFLDLFRKRG